MDSTFESQLENILHERNVVTLRLTALDGCRYYRGLEEGERAIAGIYRASVPHEKILSRSLLNFKRVRISHLKTRARNR